jgi:hypothetical protein
MAFGKNPQNADQGYQNLRVSQHGGFNQLSAKSFDAMTVDADTVDADTVIANTVVTNSIELSKLTVGIVDAQQYYELQNSEVLSSVEPGSLALGFGTAIPNATGTDNTSVGTNALSNATSGSGNTAIGNSSLNENNGLFNTAVGYGSLQGNTTANFNTGVGVNALKANQIGALNTAQGYSALATCNGGNSNVAVGAASLNTVTTGSSNSALGQGADVSSGTVSNSIILGAGGKSTASGQLVIHGTVRGLATLNAGVATISTTAVTSNTIVLFSRVNDNNNLQNIPLLGFLVATVSPGVSITVTSYAPSEEPLTILQSDNSSFFYFAFEP